MQQGQWKQLWIRLVVVLRHKVNFISTTDGKTAANLMDMRLVVQKVKAQRIGRAPLRTIILVDEAGTTHARGNPCPFGATIMQSLTK